MKEQQESAALLKGAIQNGEENNENGNGRSAIFTYYSCPICNLKRIGFCGYNSFNCMLYHCIDLFLHSRLSPVSLVSTEYITVMVSCTNGNEVNNMKCKDTN